MKMTVFELMDLRFQWEEIVRTFKMSNKSGHIDNLQHFIDNGHKANRFRDGYNEAIGIAKQILSEFNK